MKTFITCIAIFATVNSYGQIRQLTAPNPNARAATNVEGICKNIEQSLVELIKIESDNLKVFLNTQLNDTQRNEAWAAVDGSKRTQRIDEERWNKLGCIHFIKKQ